MFPLCFPRADLLRPPRPFRSRVVDASSFLSRAAAFRGGGVRWRVSPGGGGGVRRLDNRSEKKRIHWYEKRLFVSFCKKKNHKKKGQKRYFTTQTSGLFNTEHQSATHHEPKNHHRAETGTDDDVPNAHHRTRRGFFRKPLAGRRLAPFLCRGNFPIRIGTQVASSRKKKNSVAKGEEMAREAVARRLAKVRFVSPFFCDSSSARIEEDDRRCRASDRRGTFLKCHAKMCSVINQSVPPNDIQREETAVND